MKLTTGGPRTVIPRYSRFHFLIIAQMEHTTDKVGRLYLTYYRGVIFVIFCEINTLILVYIYIWYLLFRFQTFICIGHFHYLA